MLGWPGIMYGQGDYYFGAGIGREQPVGQLAERFEPTHFWTLRTGHHTAQNTFLTFEYKQIEYDQVNRSALYYDNLQMKLSIHSVAGIYQYSLLNYKGLRCNLAGGFSLNQWNFTRAAFNYSDSSQTVDLPYFERTDWSWGGQLGAGISYQPFRFVTLGISSRYHLVIAELWPALKVRLENVTGLQMLEYQFYLELDWPF